MTPQWRTVELTIVDPANVMEFTELSKGLTLPGLRMQADSG